jgi:hypothetical protein
MEPVQRSDPAIPRDGERGVAREKVFASCRKGVVLIIKLSVSEVLHEFLFGKSQPGLHKINGAICLNHREFL